MSSARITAGLWEPGDNMEIFLAKIAQVHKECSSNSIQLDTNPSREKNELDSESSTKEMTGDYKLSKLYAHTKQESKRLKSKFFLVEDIRLCGEMTYYISDYVNYNQADTSHTDLPKPNKK